MRPSRIRRTKDQWPVCFGWTVAEPEGGWKSLTNAEEIAPIGGGPQPILRRPRRADASDVLDAFCSNPDMARQGAVTDIAEAERYLGRLLGDGPAHEPWGIALDGCLVGLVCVSVDEANRSGWFWYWMHATSRGQGLMGRAAATVADWALTQRDLERLELGHRVNNPASGAVARRAGFRKEGTERGKFFINGERIDVDIYGRLRTDPFPTFEPISKLTTSVISSSARPG